MISDEQARLNYTDSEGQPQRVALSPDVPRVTIGRSPESDIALGADPEVSKLHATVEQAGGHWMLVDDGLSRNGTYLNGERLAGRQLLRHGDRIRVGATMLTFQDFDVAAVKATRVSDSVPTRRSITDVQHSVLCGLCRPYKHGAAFASPASNQQIAAELYLSVETVKSHMRELFTKFGIEDLPPNQKRVRLVERAMQSGIVNDRDL